MNVPKRGIGPATEAALQSFADSNGLSLRDALSSAGELGLGPKVTGAILELAGILDEVGATASLDQVRPAGPADVLITLLQRTRFIEALRNTGDPQDEARAENVEELISVTREFQKNNPNGTLLDFLTEVSLVAAADELDDSSGTVSLMTLHTAKGLEYEAVFLTGVEEGLLPHQMSAGEIGGPAEERRLFYVGITRARRRLYLSLAMTRAQFGEVGVAMPSRYLQEIPAELIDWKQSPGDATSRGGTRPRALNARREGGFSFRDSVGQLPSAPREKREWTSAVTNRVRDNGDLTLAVGDRIRHADFGDGRVTAVTGVAPKAVAEVQFDTAGRKRLLIKIAPIEKLS
jgi:DNA helicase-2/ATP-dependent DNA helicase PcrA